MRTIAAGKFKSKCLAIMDEVQSKCESVLITKHGKPVAKLVPAEPEKIDMYNFLAGKGVIKGDILAPAIPAKDWNRIK